MPVPAEFDSPTTTTSTSTSGSAISTASASATETATTAAAGIVGASAETSIPQPVLFTWFLHGMTMILVSLVILGAFALLVTLFTGITWVLRSVEDAKEREQRELRDNEQWMQERAKLLEREGKIPLEPERGRSHSLHDC